MAIRFTGSTNSGVTADANNDSWITLQTQYVAADIDAVDFVDFDDCEYFLQGDIYAGDDGIVSASGCNNLDIIVGVGASINAGGDGIQLLGNMTLDSGHNIVNDGAINGLAGEGVDVRATFSTFVNNGTVTAQGFGVFFKGNSNEVVNHGLVTSNVTGIGLNGDTCVIMNTGSVSATGGNGLDLQGADGDIQNTGTVTSTGIAVDMGGANGVVTNTGTLIGSIGVRLSTDIRTPELEDTSILRNGGQIVGESTGVLMHLVEAVDRTLLVNTGEIGVLDPGGLAVECTIGIDTIRNSGLIDGNVDLGAGADLFKGWFGTVDGDIHGGLGFDTIGGGAGQDVIFGDNGNDVLKGGGGNDILTGGTGRDTLRGGLGDDSFNFNSVNDSAVGAQRDHIVDFAQGEDVIDVSTIDANAGVGGNQTFDFIGNAAFSNTAGELRAMNSGGNTIVAGDRDGDGNADFQILVVGVTGLTEGDFVL